MRYGIIGTGAIGGYYGAKLAHAGQEVHFLFHSDYEYVTQHGLQVDSCNGSFHLPQVNAYQSTLDMPQCDVVLVCLKSVNNAKLQSLLPPLLHARTLVVLIQNGIGVEEDVQQQFPGVQLAAGLAFICSAKTQPGRVNHQCYGQINLGNYSCKDETLIQQVIADFNAAGVKNIDESFADKMIEMTDVMVPYSPSMKLDFEFHRSMEIHYLYTRPLQIAREAGFPMHKLEMLEAELRFIESTYKGK